MPRVLDETKRDELLATIVESYPDEVDVGALGIDDEGVCRATLAYMEENGFINVRWIPAMAGKSPLNVSATAYGYDYAEKAGLLED
ncbi:hypothetical protein [Paracoccus sp. KR1-242]|uniref:hypothetical protein n=1 Tax=Paracoccus sp. KR1-242 TaxID=3410028 RepID=UPI003C0CC64E